MELDEQNFLEELLSLRGDAWEGPFFAPAQADTTAFDCFPQSAAGAEVLPPPAAGVSVDAGSHYDYFSDVYCPTEAVYSGAPEIQHSSSVRSTLDGAELGKSACRLEVPPSEFGLRKARKKKLEGVPSKNLMAERRRRKRLNDRLSMLRSIVPKISKMDRTSILGDTIAYVRELLDKLKRLQEEIDLTPEQANLLSILNSKEVSFEVERRANDTRIGICCAAKPGLLLSTLSTLEVLGLEIQQCVLSCFNDFGMQASCSEETDQRTVSSAEDIKQALLKNAGYGGRCSRE